MSAAVALASRLDDDLAVFALMLFTVEAFALFPILRRRIQVRPLLTVFDFLCMGRSQRQFRFNPSLRYC